MTVEKSDRDELLAEIEHLRDRLAKCVHSDEDLKHAEEALQETGHRLTAILGTMEEHVLLQDREHVILWANRAAAASLEREPSELVGQKCHVLWHGSEAECPVCPVGKAWTSGSVEEADVTTPDGRAWFIKGYPLKNDGGDVENVLEVTMEVTERHHAEEALKESEERYRSLVEYAPFPIVVLGQDLKVKFVNRLMPGYEAEDVIGSSLFDHVEAEDPREVEAAIESVFETGEPAEYTIEGPSFKGGRGTYVTTVSPIVRDGKVTAVTTIARDVTTERLAARDLQESEERYRRLAESTFEGIILHDQGVIMDVNSRIEVISGYSREDLIGADIFTILEPESGELVRQRMQAGDMEPYEIHARAKDGSRLELEVQGKEIPYKGSTVRVASVRDIKARRAAEVALRESEERYRLLAENAHDVIWTMDLDLNFTYHSPSVEAQRGFTSEEAKGQSVEDIMTPASYRKVTRAVEEVLVPILGGEADPRANVTMELELYRKDGTTILTETSISLMLDEEGEPVGILGVTRDITERKAAEEAIDRSESRYRLLAENVEDIIFTLGNDLTFNYVSPSFVRLTGHSIEELIEMGWEGLFAPEGLERMMEAVTDDAFGIMERGKEARRSSLMIEAELKRKDGTSLWVEVNVSAIFDDAGDVKEILGVARDISERRATQERFLEEKKRAELYLDLFGHDIRNINQGIMSYLELMLMRPGLDPDEADYIKSVLEQATRINDLVAKVQRLTQLRSRRIEVEDVDAEPLIQAAIDYVLAKYPYRDIQLNTSCTLDNHVVKGTRLLTDVFTSILDNSVRFNRRDTVEVDIFCRGSKDGDAIQFVFEDRGPGIADETKDKVFHRLEQPEGGVKGSGLGLTVVWEIMRQLGGRVWVEDRVYGDATQGSRFIVELLLADR
jgi:PAS domain S-box-containing protein